MKFLIWTAVNALALAAAAWLVDGIRITGATTQDQVVTLVLVALIFGVVNAVIAPVVKLLALPFILLTLGLLVFVINALMLMFTAWLAGQLDLGFRVDGFWAAVFGAIVIAIATWVLELVLDQD